jgi:hypothetical protein
LSMRFLPLSFAGRRRPPDDVAVLAGYLADLAAKSATVNPCGAGASARAAARAARMRGLFRSMPPASDGADPGRQRQLVF